MAASEPKVEDVAVEPVAAVPAEETQVIEEAAAEIVPSREEQISEMLKGHAARLGEYRTALYASGVTENLINDLVKEADRRFWDGDLG